MKEWEYTFDAVSKAEWIRQITTDLKQKPIASLAGEWWESEARQPVSHREDLHDEVVRLPAHLFSKAPLITEDIAISLTDPGKVNKYILDALQQGVQSILFHVPSTATIFNTEWIEDVHLDWITFQVEPDHMSPESLNTFLQLMPEHAMCRIARTTSAIPLGSVLSQQNHLSPSALNAIRFIYRIPSTGIWKETTAEIFNSLLQDLHQWAALGYDRSAFLNQCIISLEADQDYFKQILQTRVLHLLWHNLHQHYLNASVDFDTKYLETHILQKADEKPEHFLIRASMAALASSLSGTNALCIHHSHEEQHPVFFQRINRNIHHLLELESGMYKGTDPLAGAYSLDYPTKKWTTAIWESIHLGK